MKVLLCPVGSRGDVEPMLVLASELTRRGHAVSMAAPPNFRAVVEAAGLPFRALGADTEIVIREHVALSERSQVRALPAQIALLKRETAAQCHGLLQNPPEVDLVVGAGLSFAARLLAEQQRARYAFVCYSLSAILSGAHPPATLPVFGLPKFGNRGLWWLALRGFDRSVGQVLARIRAEYGLAADLHPWRTIHATSTILAQDEVLGSLPPDARSSVVQVPALSRAPSKTPLTDGVSRFLEAARFETNSGVRPPLVYVGFGSMPTVDRERVVRAVSTLNRETGARVLLFSEREEDARFELPEGVLRVGVLDHAQLFPKLDLVVHHGGAGTTATALRAGVAQMIVPHIVDQFFHGRRIAELGLGPTPSKKRELEARLSALSWSEVHAQRSVAQRLAATLPASGAAQAVDFLERG